MQGREWIRSGPRVGGYRPGWLWWAAAAGLLAIGIWLLTHTAQRHQINDTYIAERIAYHADAQGLDVGLVEAVVEAESGGDWLAKSQLGAKGLMQIMPVAHEDVRERFDVKDGDLYDPDYNLRVGTLYLSYLLKRFKGDTTLALAAYHMGPTKVSKHQKQNPGMSSLDLVQRFGGPQTRAYVDKVLGMYDEHSEE